MKMYLNDGSDNSSARVFLSHCHISLRLYIKGNQETQEQIKWPGTEKQLLTVENSRHFTKHMSSLR